MEAILLLSLIVASISFTITVTSIFEWFRELLSLIHPKVEQLIHCPYCLGHYITIFIVLFTDKYVIFTGNYIYDVILTIFCVMGTVAVLHYIILRAYEPIAKIHAMREIEKKKKLKTQNS